MNNPLTAEELRKLANSSHAMDCDYFTNGILACTCGLDERREAALRLAAEMCEWHSIETAPTDVLVLLCWKDWTGNWEYRTGYAYCTNGGVRGWAHGYATHWRPLPTPPAEGGA